MCFLKTVVAEGKRVVDGNIIYVISIAELNFIFFKLLSQNIGHRNGIR
jgi:hypothetical protein